MNSSIQRLAALPLPSHPPAPHETPRLGISPRAIPRSSADAPADIRLARAARTGWILAIALLFAHFGLSPAWAFQIGDRVRTTGAVNVRPSAGGTPAYQVGQPSGAWGRIKSRSVEAKIGGVGPTYTWWDIDFDNGQDGWVAGINLAAIDPSLAPRVDEVGPQPLIADAGNAFQNVTLTGVNFAPDAKAILTWRGESGYTVTANRITVLSKTQIRLSLRLGAEADNWTVRIINPDGQASNMKAFTVLAPALPAPIITSVEPQPLVADPANGLQTVTVRGANFRSGVRIELDWTDVSGWALEASRIQVVSSTEIRISIRLGREADDWSVRVINPDGKRSEKAFRVEAAAKPAPLLQSVDQEPVVADPANGYQDIGLRGTNLEDVVGVILGWTGQPEYVLSPTRIRVISGSEVQISVKLGGEADQWTAQVIHRDGRRSNVIRFEVIADVAPPVFHALRISAEHGSVSTTPALQEFEHGTEVSLHATPAAGFEFGGWEGGITGIENPVTVTMNQDLDITARFVALPTPGQLSVVGFRDGLVDLILSGSVGRSYRIEGSEDLTHWESLKTVVVPASGRAEFRLGVGDLAHFFFQAELDR